ncbi:dynamin family protein [Exiguobacterium sp. SL-9]|uniref:dynamin family protein n=1 Tax=Exiguobacterium sp. SL-9 TaxID=2510963 RepID=UPI00103FF04E|nr:dynamin family protein [Exiguobacterium sp. SL-9]TCI22628.1 hypothetical protein EVJ34_08430 [Exiguobacterium sp. SL-9]
MEKLTQYKNSINNLVSTANSLQKIAVEIEEDDLFEQLKMVKLWAEEQDLLLATVGEVSVGKSSFLNALLKQPVLPVSMKESTALVTHVRRGENLKASLYIEGEQIFSSKDLESFNDSYTVHSKRWKDESVGRLARFKKIMTTKNEVNEDTYIEIQLNHPLLQNRVRIIDTPGLNDSGGIRSVITKRFVRKADAAIVLMRADKLLSNSEMMFFEEYILKKHVDHIFILVNRFDKLAEGDQLTVKEAAYKKFGELNIPEKNIFFISAKQAVQANSLEKIIEKGEGDFPTKALQRQAASLTPSEKVSLAQSEMTRLRETSALNDFFDVLQEFLVSNKGEGRKKKIENQLQEIGKRLLNQLDEANKDLLRTNDEVKSELERNQNEHKQSIKVMESTRQKFNEKTRTEKHDFIKRFEKVFESIKKEVEAETKLTHINSSEAANALLKARADELMDRIQSWIVEELPRIEQNVRQIYLNEYSSQLPAVQNMFVMPTIRSEFIPAEIKSSSSNTDAAALTGAAVGFGAAALLGIGIFGALLLIPAAAMGAAFLSEESSSSTDSRKLKERVKKEIEKLYVRVEKESKKTIQAGFDSSVEAWMKDMEESIQKSFKRTEKRLKKIEQSFKDEETNVTKEIEYVNSLKTEVHAQLDRI